MNNVSPLLSLNYRRPYTALASRLKHKISKDRNSHSSWSSIIFSNGWMLVIGQGLFSFWPFISLKTSPSETKMNTKQKKTFSQKFIFSVLISSLYAYHEKYGGGYYTLCTVIVWIYNEPRQSFSSLIQERSFCKWRSSVDPALLWLFSVTIGEITT